MSKAPHEIIAPLVLSAMTVAGIGGGILANYELGALNQASASARSFGDRANNQLDLAGATTNTPGETIHHLNLARYDNGRQATEQAAVAEHALLMGFGVGAIPVGGLALAGLINGYAPLRRTARRQA